MEVDVVGIREGRSTNGTLKECAVTESRGVVDHVVQINSIRSLFSTRLSTLASHRNVHWQGPNHIKTSIPLMFIMSVSIHVFLPELDTRNSSPPFIFVPNLVFPLPGAHAHAQTLFVLAILWRHRLRYAFDKFLWTGKVDEGVAKTISSNLSTLQGTKVPRRSGLLLSLTWNMK
jgi:hypothetical protein